jgi:CRISPR-associated protein Cas5t
MLTLYIEAPFAVCRTFTAGWYRPSATFLTPSAAYGLLLNLAGIETRLREEDDQHPGTVPATLIRTGLPALKLALGAPAVSLRAGHAETIPEEADRYPLIQTVYQQLHNYPVGASGGERAATTFGNKYNITPVRRELLVGLRAVVAVDGDTDLEAGMRRGLAGDASAGRYGLPFVGDNAFLPDRIEALEKPPKAHWYEKVAADQHVVRARTTRLTVWIDREDLSRTQSQLYAPSSETDEIPEAAWTRIDPTADPTVAG